MSIEKLYTTSEAAGMLRLSEKTVLNKMSARQIRYIKGRPALIPESSIKEYLKKREQRALT